MAQTRERRLVKITDSYTGEIYEEPVACGASGEPRSFYRQAEKLSAMYLIRPSPAAVPPSPAAPEPASWEILRIIYPGGGAVLTTIPDLDVAREVADWMLRNDATVEIALRRAAVGDSQALFNILMWSLDAATS
jgi:hypothetical protein